MKERVYLELSKRKPVHAEGHICIDLTDPITGKVKNRIEGKNHVFTGSLFSGKYFDWVSSVSNVWLCLNDSTAEIDTTIPYLLGQTAGYGRPSSAGSGSYRGAYNAANQVLAKMSAASVRWKFHYDFTTAQANNIQIGTIGLTHQYDSLDNAAKEHVSGFQAAVNTNLRNTCDGRYNYVCSTAGIITKYDLWNGTFVTIDVSATVGTTAATTKFVGYAPATGMCYVYCYSATAALRKMYAFTDNTFATVSATYDISNIAITAATGPLYIYDNVVYYFSAQSVYYANFVNNTAYVTLTISTRNNAAYAETALTATGSFGEGTCAFGGKYVYCMSLDVSYNKGIIFDLSTASLAGYVTGDDYSYYKYSICRHPCVTEELICSVWYYASLPPPALYHNAAIAAYKLVTPITKTSANGMTATYELEVFW